MKYEALQMRVGEKKRGQYAFITWEKELPVRVQYKGTHRVMKVTSGVVRVGVTYDNMKSVKDKRADGTLPESNAGLPWGKWKVPGLFIEHNGKIYLRVAQTKGDKFESIYYLDGNKTEKSVIEPLCLKSAFTNHNDLDVFNIEVSKIIEMR